MAAVQDRDDDARSEKVQPHQSRRIRRPMPSCAPTSSRLQAGLVVWRRAREWARIRRRTREASGVDPWSTPSMTNFISLPARLSWAEIASRRRRSAPSPARHVRGLVQPGRSLPVLQSEKPWSRPMSARELSSDLRQRPILPSLELETVVEYHQGVGSTAPFRSSHPCARSERHSAPSSLSPSQRRSACRRWPSPPRLLHSSAVGENDLRERPRLAA